MALLSLALSIFIVTHLFPAFPNAKTLVIEKIGRKAYITIFSFFSVISLSLIIYAKIEAPFIDVYEPPSWSRYFALSLMLPATILIIASFLPGHIRKITGTPIFYATLLWVTAHLVANGDKASILLFGSLGLYAFVSKYLMTKQQDNSKKEEKQAHSWADASALIGGAITYATLVSLHGYIIGVDIWY